MNIVYKTLEEIFPYANNPRKNDDAVEAVAKSIQEFGFKVPIVIDKNGVIVTGHTRYKAAMRIGMTEVPCIIADDLTEDQVNAFRIVDNKVSEIAEWDYELLSIELEDISIDMSEFGFENALVHEDEKNDTKSIALDEKCEIIIEFLNENEMQQAYEKLTSEGYSCRISTL